MKYVHTKLRYEIEIPNELVEDKLDELVVTSHRTGFQRFHTEELRGIYEQYEVKIHNMKQALTPFVCAIF